MSDYKVTINSSLLNSDDFKHVKKSIEKVSAIDHKEDFRVNLIEYINDSSTNSDDMFFYDMLEFVNFLEPGSDAIAFTTPEKLIYMNAPNDKIGEKYRQWEFVYDHECLHQLWETFDVQSQIDKEDGDHNHELLNIASDCVINDYLYHIRKKERPDGLVTPEFIKEKFGVDYDRKIDTQYTLYRKLEKVVEENKDLQKLAQQYGGDEQQNGNEQNQQNSNENGGQQGKDKDQKGKQSGNSGQQDRQQGNEKGQQGQGNSGQQGNEKGQQGQGNGGQQGNEKDQQGQGNSGQQGNEKDQQGSQSGENGQQGGQQGQETKSNGGNADQQNGVSRAAGSQKGDTPEETDQDIKELSKRAKAIVENYKNKISGAIGSFLEKCKASKAMKDEGLGTKTLGRGAQSWNEKMNNTITAYVKNRVFQKKREMETTYTRVKRGSGVIKFGQPIVPGKRIKEEKLIINTAFYIDRSGSMSNDIDNAFEALYIIVESLKKQFGKDKVVEDITAKIFAFDMEFSEIKFGKKCSANGGTMSFDKLLDGIMEKTNDCMINVVITDAGFGGVDESKISKLLDELDGILLFITNTQEPQIEAIANKHKTKMTFIFAGSDFSLSNSK